jgi:hypothetical protein
VSELATFARTIDHDDFSLQWARQGRQQFAWKLSETERQPTPEWQAERLIVTDDASTASVDGFLWGAADGGSHHLAVKPAEGLGGFEPDSWIVLTQHAFEVWGMAATAKQMWDGTRFAVGLRRYRLRRCALGWIEARTVPDYLRTYLVGQEAWDIRLLRRTLDLDFIETAALLRSVGFSMDLDPFVWYRV